MRTINGVNFMASLVIALLIKLAFFTNYCDNIETAEHKIDPELQGYLVSFVDLAKLKGIDLTYVYGQDIYLKFYKEGHGTQVATSFGRNKDRIIIMVDRDRFYARTEEGRKYVMFHELGHDILNFEHLEHPERGMMEPTAYTGFFKNYDRFTKETQESYLYKSLNGMFDIYLTRKYPL